MRFIAKKGISSCRNKTLSWASIAFDDSREVACRRKPCLLSASRDLPAEEKKEILYRHFKTSDKNKPKMHRITSFYLNKTFSNIFMPRSKSSSSLCAQREASKVQCVVEGKEEEEQEEDGRVKRSSRRLHRQQARSITRSASGGKVQRSNQESNRFVRKSQKSPSVMRRESALMTKSGSNRSNIDSNQKTGSGVGEERTDDNVFNAGQEIFIYKNIQKTIRNLALANFLYYLPLSVVLSTWYCLFDSLQTSALEGLLLTALCLSYSCLVLRNSVAMESLKRIP